MRIVVWCDEQMPRRGRPWSALPGLQQLVTVIAMPLGAAAVTVAVFQSGDRSP